MEGKGKKLLMTWQKNGHGSHHLAGKGSYL
jgi:hypothetical protein